MTYYHCKACGITYYLEQLDPEYHLLQKSMRCPRDKCKGDIKVTPEEKLPHAGRFESVSALFLFQATRGRGLTQERKCSPTRLKKTLVGAKVVGVQLGASPDPDRALVYSLTLDNGKTVHLASSSKGATVYKMTEDEDGR